MRLKPWLIEVNASPSLARDNALDREVKDALLADTLEIVTAVLRSRRMARDGAVAAGSAW